MMKVSRQVSIVAGSFAQRGDFAVASQCPGQHHGNVMDGARRNLGKSD